MAGAVVAVELVGLAELLEHRLGPVDLIGRRVGIVVAEDAEQWAAQVFGKLDRSARALVIEQRGIVHNDVAAPAVDRGIDVGQTTGNQKGVTSARAEAHHRDLAVAVGQGAQIFHRARDIADHLFVGYAPGGAYARPDVVGIAGAFAEIEMRGDAEEAVVGELARHFLDPFVPAGHVVDDDDAREGTGPERSCEVGFAQIAVVAFECHSLGEHGLIGKVHGVLARLGMADDCAAMNTGPIMRGCWRRTRWLACTAAPAAAVIAKPIEFKDR